MPYTLNIPRLTSVTFAVVIALTTGGRRPVAAQAAATPPRTTIDECKLLTPDQVSSIVGWKVQKSGKVSSGIGCHYSGPNEISNVAAIVVSSGMPPMANSTKMAEWRRKQLKRGWEDDFVIEPIEDLGMPAIQNSLKGAGLWGVEVEVRGRLLTVSTTASLSAAKALARSAAARMP